MLKRVLPFILTLITGTVLGGMTNHSSLPADNTAPPSHARRYCQIASSDRTWLVIHSQPTVYYTEAARRNNVTGVVRVRVLLDSRGEVQVAEPIERLPYGLTEEAVEAAKRIQFTPATENGRPISVWLEIVHEFTGHGGVFSYVDDSIYEKD